MLLKTVLCLTLLANLSGISYAQNIPDGLEAFPGEDGTVWERVSTPGFGSNENMAAVAMAEYSGRLYAMVRNDNNGVEVWRTSGTAWEQVNFPAGITNGIYNNHMINSHMGAMIVFNGKLYFGFSSGIQGSYLRSSGCEVWRYDGTNWEPVISDKKDQEESGTITALSGCADSDGDITAQITDEIKSWGIDQWAGGILQITSGEGVYRRFDIISNTSDTLTVQQNEIAGNLGSEYTICESTHYVNPFPPHEYDLGRVDVGNTYEIGTGDDENGFGDYWNKAIPQMATFENKLYVSTVLNYDYGGQVWYSEDGDNWTVSQPPYSLGIFHTDAGYPNSQKPVTRGIPGLIPCNVATTEILYAGCLGSDGNLGGCARMAKLTETGWELIVHVDVDENDTGTNENGFGDGMDCTMFNGNFNAWSLACFKSKLYVGIQSLGGTRVLYTPNGSSEDGSWFFSAGGDSLLPNGFDGALNEGASSLLGETVYQNIAVDIYTFGDYLYAGLTSIYMPVFGATFEYLAGSQMWKTFDGINWDLVTRDGFGDIYVLNFEAFADFNGTLYVAASRAANTVGSGLGGVTILRLTSGPTDDYDSDGIVNNTDNCPLVSNTEQADLGDEDGIGDVCDNCPTNANPNQEDNYPPPQGNNIGDACDCEADFNCDGNVDATDITSFLTDFGRNQFNNPCTTGSPCNGDINCDSNVDATDVTKFLEDFGRNQFNNPCPSCVVGAWCDNYSSSSGCGPESGFSTGERIIMSQDVERVYYLKLPENYNSHTSYPLIFAFHGLGGNYTMWTEGYYDLQDVVGEEAILVYPNALLKNNVPQWDYDTDPSFFDDLYAELEANLCFDIRKVFAVGHSNGAGMSHTLGCKRGNILRAIGPVAGSLTDYEDLIGQVAVMQIHGSNDNTFPVESIKPTRDYWIAINGCNEGETEEGMHPTCVAYSGCDSNFPVQYCEHSGGHEWPDFASSAIWAFFQNLPPTVPSDETGSGDIGNLGNGTISFKIHYPSDFVGTPYKLALALYPYDSTQPFAGSPLYFLSLDISVGDYIFGEVTEYDNVEINLLGVEYGDYTLTVVVYIEGSSYPMPSDGIDYMGLQNFTLDSKILEVTTPFELELVEW